MISAGQIKLHNGSLLVIDNSVKPAFDANPKPVEQ